MDPRETAALQAAEEGCRILQERTALCPAVIYPSSSEGEAGGAADGSSGASGGSGSGEGSVKIGKKRKQSTDPSEAEKKRRAGAYKARLERGKRTADWTPAIDARLVELQALHGNKWAKIAPLLGAEFSTGFSGQMCRVRFIDHLQ